MSQTPPDTRKKEAIDWLLKLRSPECSQADRRNFNAWLARHPDNQTVYDRMNAHWEGLDRFKGRDSALRRRVLSYRPARAKQAWRPHLAVAAATLLAVGIASLSLAYWNTRSGHYRTAIGGLETMVLSDGSRLELNSDTDIRVRIDERRRTVALLKGEVFFTVVHDADRPFVVTAANGRIEDIGTAFSVYLTDDSVRVAVAEGKVKIGTGQTRELTAKQMAAYHRNGDFEPVASTNPEALTAWRDGYVVFDNRRLDDVLIELRRYRNIELRLANQTVAALKFSGRFRIDRFDSGLDAIASTLGIAIRRLNDGAVVLG
ncbi:FecR family protein [Methylomonas sp. UP202]|uniref:FecR family protein n=1 Tax=Methylomonas sp. UP202 TaxID=3040943 RepID=UPI0024798134|nr:FecR family protein [Methylomonas sp. UP202]WGS85767.1 FecR family protein [Methylomonas sp. UP202]